MLDASTSAHEHVEVHQLVLTALTLGMPVAHALVMPVRRAYEPALWVMVTHTLYYHFATVGVALEVGAIVGAVVLAILVWRRPRPARSALGPPVAGAACLVLAQALWWLLVFPVNQEFSTWTPDSVPVDWTRYRDR